MNFATLTSELKHSLSDSQKAGINTILAATQNAGWGPSWTAYALATAWHETMYAMVPVNEIGGDAYFEQRYGAKTTQGVFLGNVLPGDGAKFHGRGYVQLTGRRNYKHAGELLNIDLVDSPDDALKPNIAAPIMVRGMAEGWFTGHRLAQFLDARSEETIVNFVQARRIINGSDRADIIAAYAMAFQAALNTGESSNVIS